MLDKNDIDRLQTKFVGQVHDSPVLVALWRKRTRKENQGVMKEVSFAIVEKKAVPSGRGARR
jgi:hypothetical protein